MTDVPSQLTWDVYVTSKSHSSQTIFLRRHRAAMAANIRELISTGRDAVLVDPLMTAAQARGGR